MDVLLINPDSSLRQARKTSDNYVSPVPPIGLAYLAAVLKQNKIEVSVEDQFASKISNNEVFEIIKEVNPSVVGISCLTSAMVNVEKIIRGIKDINKEIVVVLGNIHATVFVNELLENRTTDFIVRGEGEYTFLELIKALKGNVSLPSVRGISYIEDGSIRHNPDRELIENLDELPYPAWELFNLHYYKNFPIIAVYNNIIFPLQASRGCPYRCIFCSQDKMYRYPRYRSIESVIGEIKYSLNKFNVNHFGFNDAYFPFSIEHGFKFVNRLVEEKLDKKIKWITESRVDKVNLGLLRALKKTGLVTIMYGFEVGNQSILDSLNKKTTLEQAKEAAMISRKAGIRVLGLFVLGLPGESVDTCNQTINFAKELACDIAKFNLAVPLPGSQFFRNWKSTAKDKHETDKFTSWYTWYSSGNDLIYTPEGMTSNELVNLQRKAMIQFYLRLSFIARHIFKRTFPIKDLVYGLYVLLVKLFGYKRV